MPRLLEKIFIKTTKDENSNRLKYGVFYGLLGIILNVLLFAGKLVAGIFSGSIAIIADALNNLS
ncbi:MAG: cation-efflux pump, partial [Bacilli bacterium]